MRKRERKKGAKREINKITVYTSYSNRAYMRGYCKDQFRLRSNTGMDPGPRSPNNEFVECGKKS